MRPEQPREKLKRFVEDLRARAEHETKFKLVPSVPLDLVEFVAGAIEKYLNGTASLNTAFGVSAKRGRPPSKTAAKKDKELARQVCAIWCKDTKQSWSDIIAKMDLPAHGDDSAIRRAWAKFAVELISEKINKRLKAKDAAELAKRVKKAKADHAALNKRIKKAKSARH